MTHYEAGDYLVSNNPDGSDGYAIGAATFEALYAPDDEDTLTNDAARAHQLALPIRF